MYSFFSSLILYPNYMIEIHDEVKGLVKFTVTSHKQEIVLTFGEET